MSVRMKDFLERLGFTLLLAAISFGIVYLTDIPEPWALAILAFLQIAKNLVAQQVGDPATSGFTDPLKDSFNVDNLPVGDPDGVVANPDLQAEADEAGDDIDAVIEGDQ